MDPLFLREVENRPGTGPFAGLIKMMQSKGEPVPQIAYLFAFKGIQTDHLSRFTQAVMRGPSPLSPGMRELIAALTSSENHCPF